MSMIKFDSNGTTYVMEFNRATALKAEQLYDVSMGAIQDGQLSQLPNLFHAAFLLHHPNIKRSTTQAFFDAFKDKEMLYGQLAKMYFEALEESVVPTA